MLGEVVRKRLRSPIYLDLETLTAQAEYHNIVTPPQKEIVEKGVRREARGLLGGDLEARVEYQSTFTLEPRMKAVVSEIIDQLMAKEIAVRVGTEGAATLERDDLIEIGGKTRMTAVCLAGKMFYLLRQIVQQAKGDLNDIFSLDMETIPALEQFKGIYHQNELPPIPILLQVEGATLPQKVYVNLRPDHFVDRASVDRVEGDLRVLGTVRLEIPGGNDGYLSSEEWLLHDWEYLFRRKLMAELDDTLENLMAELDLDLPHQDVHSFITGPALIIDAIALY